jgi:hypothetical protein
MEKHTWNATNMFLSRKKSCNEKTEGPKMPVAETGMPKMGTLYNAYYRKVSSLQSKFQERIPGHGQGLA